MNPGDSKLLQYQRRRSTLAKAAQEEDRRSQLTKASTVTSRDNIGDLPNTGRNCDPNKQRFLRFFLRRLDTANTRS